MKCPICENWGLDEYDEELVCTHGCGAAFALEYLGMYEEGSSERRDEGDEPIEWLEKYGDTLEEWKGSL